MARGKRRQNFWLVVLFLLGVAGMTAIVTLGPEAAEATADVVGLR